MIQSKVEPADGRAVVLAMVSDTWTDAVRRGFYSTADQFFLSLMEDERVGRILIADHPRGLLSQVRRRMRGDKPAPHTPTLDGVRPLTVRTSLPTSTGGVRRRYRMYDRQIGFVVRRRELDPPALVTFNLWHAAYGDHSRYSRVDFYAQDDERAIPRLSHLADRITAAYAEINRRGIPVHAVSDELHSRIARSGSGSVIPNGVDPVLWHRLPAAMAATAARTKSPVAVYAGTIDDRLDVTAVRELVLAGFAVHLAGPTPDQAVRRKLEGCAGVTLLGSLHRSQIPGLLAQADLCFLAHRRTELTTAMSPLKLYEYLCSGTPVVATALPGITLDRDLLRNVTLVEPGDDFGAPAQLAVARGRLDEAARKDAVQRLSWRSRHAPLIDALVGR